MSRRDPAKLRKQAAALEKEADAIAAKRASDAERFIVIERVQDGRSIAYGPFKWTEAARVEKCQPNREICEWRGDV